MNKSERGKGVVLSDVTFEEQKSVINKQSFMQLNELYEFMSANPAVKIRLEGHTDKIGSKIKNLDLSKARASAVKSYLVQKGLPSHRIVAVGYGDSKPICQPKCDSNRRVELILTSE